MQIQTSTNSLPNQQGLVSNQEKSVIATIGEITRKISLIAIATLGFAAAGAATVISLGADIVVLEVVVGIAGVIGFIFALIMTRGKKQEINKTESKPQSFEELNDQIKRNFVEANEKKIGDIIELVENAQGSSEKGVPLTNEQLDQVLEVIDDTKVRISSQYQFDHLRQQLLDEFGEGKLEEIYRNRSILPESLLDINKVLSNEAIDFVLQRARTYYANQEVIERLRLQIDERILNRRLEKLDLQNLANGLITPEIEEAILAHLEAEVEFEKLAEAIKAAANRDLYFDDAFIEERFHINQKLNELPEEDRQVRRDELQNIINQAYITRELNNRGKITTGDATEVALLRNWDYLRNNLSATYFDKDSLYTMVREIITSQLREEQCVVPLKYVKELINLCALRTRLRTVNITNESEIEKFQVSCRFYKETQNSLHRRCEQNLLEFPEDFTLPATSLAVQEMQQHYQSTQKSITNRLINRNFRSRSLLQQFKNSNVSPVDYQSYLDQNTKNNIENAFNVEIASNKPQSKSLQQYIEFYKKWQSFLQVGLIQGFQDENEALGKGVCWGICQRLRLTHQKDKDFSLEAFAQEINGGLIAHDRYLQGLYSTNFNIAKQGSVLPEALLKGHGYKEEALVFDIKGQEGRASSNRKIIKKLLLQSITAQTEALQLLNGWLHLSLKMETGGHATLLRLDKNSGHVWFFDPNFGLFAFEGEDRSFEEARALCCEFINDLIEIAYSDIWIVAGIGLIPA